jgi:uncharacterized membrane protein
MMYRPISQTQPVSNINIGKNERYLSLVGAFALLAIALKRRDLVSLALVLMSSKLFYRGITGHSYVNEWLGRNPAVETNPARVSVPHQQGIHVVQSVTIRRSPEELYQFWRNLENLPRFMEHVESVEVYGNGRSHWRVKAPLGMNVEWDAEIITDLPNEVIGWRSLEDSQIANAGSVRFAPAYGNNGTEMRVTLEYAPPAGKLGHVVATLLGENPQQQVRTDLLRLKQLMEVGQIASTEGQPSGRETGLD